MNHIRMTFDLCLEFVIGFIATIDKGRISFDEFVATMTPKMRSAATEEDLRQTFNAFDVDRNGAITDDDIRTLYQRLGHDRIFQDEMAATIRAADVGANSASGITFAGRPIQNEQNRTLCIVFCSTFLSRFVTVTEPTT